MRPAHRVGDAGGVGGDADDAGDEDDRQPDRGLASGPPAEQRVGQQHARRCRCTARPARRPDERRDPGGAEEPNATATASSGCVRRHNSAEIATRRARSRPPATPRPRAAPLRAAPPGPAPRRAPSRARRGQAAPGLGALTTATGRRSSSSQRREPARRRYRPQVRVARRPIGRRKSSLPPDGARRPVPSRSAAPVLAARQRILEGDPPDATPPVPPGPLLPPAARGP